MASVLVSRGLESAKRVVIKIGSALLTNDGRGLDAPAVAVWVQHIADLRNRGVEVVLVSSGAVAEGMNLLNWAQRPTALNELQAAAAVGQVNLVQLYQQEFRRYDRLSAQILLVHDDLLDRRRYLNARSTLKTLLSLGVIPIVNENDTVATDEIRFGDNDTLAAMVANIIDADALVILTDQDAMYDKDPRHHSDATIIREMAAASPELYAMAGDGGALGRGGMTTKVRAAELAARSGTNTTIVGGRIENVLQRLFAGEALGTLLYAQQEPLEARKLWLAGIMPRSAKLVLDAGAVQAIRRGGVSVLPVGVLALEGDFTKGDMVLCVDEAGKPVAKGLINYNADDCLKIKGASRERVTALLGYQGAAELIHCDNSVLL